ncbi:hypothetical protein H0H93_014320 [Arthromyces matolae]|nr:hypothetical protein H0H93_014320 [Arthromyces matolae]
MSPTVTPPLSNTRLSRLIYVLILLTTVLGAYYTYRIVQWKTEVGGWWNLALRRPPLTAQTYEFSPKKFRTGKAAAPVDIEETVEDRIEGLARALGMPSKDLASAIAVAVREYVPPASLSSIAAKETGEAVRAMLQGEQEKTSTSGIGSLESFVGMEEPLD